MMTQENKKESIMKKGIIFGTLLLISHPTATAEVECLTVDVLSARA